MDAGAEQQVPGSTGYAVAESQASEDVDRDRVVVGPARVAEPLAGAEVVRVDAPGAEVADQQGTAEAAESGPVPAAGPGRVQRARLTSTRAARDAAKAADAQLWAS